jgi:uncharacterized protein YcfJ
MIARGLTLLVAAGAILAAGALPSEARNLRAYCDGYARDVADRKDTPVANTLAGAAVGAAAGAIIGGAIGHHSAGTGAIIGGVSGTALGAGASSAQWRRNYDKAFARCMDQYAAEPVYQRAPPQGSDEWYDYCASKYPSFNPNTGMYRSASGKWRRCR